MTATSEGDVIPAFTLPLFSNREAPVTRRLLLVDERGECCEGFSHFVNRRNRASRSYSDLTDWKLAGPNSPIVCPHRRTEANKQTNNSLAENYTHGGCRGTVVGAVVEIEQADEAEVRRGGICEFETHSQASR